MFWDRVAGVYDLFVNVVNRNTHKALRQIVADLIDPEDVVLECACGTGLLTTVIAEKCKPGGKLIIPTYMNKDQKGDTSGFASVVGKAGADFKRQFTVESYRKFFLDARYKDVKVSLADGKIPCAVATMTKEEV